MSSKAQAEGGGRGGGPGGDSSCRLRRRPVCLLFCRARSGFGRCVAAAHERNCCSQVRTSKSYVRLSQVELGLQPRRCCPPDSYGLVNGHAVRLNPLQKCCQRRFHLECWPLLWTAVATARYHPKSASGRAFSLSPGDSAFVRTRGSRHRRTSAATAAASAQQERRRERWCGADFKPLCRSPRIYPGRSERWESSLRQPRVLPWCARGSRGRAAFADWRPPDPTRQAGGRTASMAVSGQPWQH